MALPTYKGNGVFAADVTAVTPAMPVDAAAPAAGDILLCVATSEAQAIALSTANGFAEVTLSPVTVGAFPGGMTLAVFWKRAVGGDASPVVADSGDHTTAQIHCFAGCKTTGDPWNVISVGTDEVSDTTGVIPGATTTVAECLVVLIGGSSFNATSTAAFSAWANADLANVAERVGADNISTAGAGSGHGLATGEKAAAGAYGNTTFTSSFNTPKAMMTIALAPVEAAGGGGWTPSRGRRRRS
jgi:hypothetical protein